MNKLLSGAHTILQEAIDIYNPSGVYALFSGGYDSLVNTHVVSQHPRFSGVIHINTGIGIEETRQFVRDTCKAYGWPLREYQSTITYRETVLEEGFPGPACHKIMYIKLKERAIAQFIRETKIQYYDRIVLAAGARKEESVRRMGTTQKMRRDKVRVWVNPLFDWKKTDILNYMEENHLPQNEVVDLMHMSGECLCGCFAKEGERAMIRDLYPKVDKYLSELEDEARAAGFPWGWGEEPPSWFMQVRKGQEYLPDFAPLCSSCSARYEREEKAGD